MTLKRRRRGLHSMAKEEGTYETYEGSPTSRPLQPDLWNASHVGLGQAERTTPSRAELVALGPVPTASTAKF